MNYTMTFGSAMAMELPVSGDAAFLASLDEKFEELEEELDEVEAYAFEDELERQMEVDRLMMSISSKYLSAIEELR